jgi:hypothetical protein
MKFIVYVNKRPHVHPLVFIADDVVDDLSLCEVKGIDSNWILHVLESDEVNVVGDVKDVIKVMVEESR